MQERQIEMAPNRCTKCGIGRARDGQVCLNCRADNFNEKRDES